MTQPSYTRLDLAAQDKLLRSIVSRSAPQAGKRASVIFDLDGTLLENRPRTAVIFEELGREWARRGLAEAKHLQDVSPSRLAYLVSHSLEALGVTNASLIKEAEQFWKERFFVDAYLGHDTALSGAVAFARACYDAGANLVYFTGRDLPKMALGSFASLRDAGFPIGVSGTELVLKPSFDMPDEAYKRDAAGELSRVGDPIAFFDNEPGNCNAFRELFPQAESVFVDTQHFPGAPALLADVHVIGDFELSQG